MDDPAFVGRFERLRDLPRDRQGFFDGNRAAPDALRQVVALGQFHHQRPHAVGGFEPVDVRDVRMIERREQLRFAREPRKPFSVVGE